MSQHKGELLPVRPSRPAFRRRFRSWLDGPYVRHALADALRNEAPNFHSEVARDEGLQPEVNFITKHGIYGSYVPATTLRFRAEPLRPKGSGFVEDNRDVVALGLQLGIAALYQVAIVLLGFYNQQHLVHEGAHTPSGAGLA